mmetsp:Transcript_2181/g.2279  ORF Transcript_2181/g.2279 Transcript_2181/m.2279 type:complete len:212 (-) Transcript_2181:239-874(-)
MSTLSETSPSQFENVLLLCKNIKTNIKGSHSINTTRSNTPEGKESNSNKGQLIIDVKPKKKNFNSAEERKEFVKSYKMKYKTEMCKNFELKGYCKFGDTCSFAHGRHELHEKVHLHEKYKTRPCQQFHQNGYCSYGLRCQYLHKEGLSPNVFYVSKGESVSNAERKNYSYELLDEIWRMSNSNIKVEKILDKIPERKRLAIFHELAPQEIL